jgi:hypothetical protein
MICKWLKQDNDHSINGHKYVGFGLVPVLNVQCEINFFFYNYNNFNNCNNFNSFNTLIYMNTINFLIK